MSITEILGRKREILRATYMVENSLFARLLVRAGITLATIAALALFYTSSVEVHTYQQGTLTETTYKVESSLFPHLELVRPESCYSEECAENVIRW